MQREVYKELTAIFITIPETSKNFLIGHLRSLSRAPASLAALTSNRPAPTRSFFSSSFCLLPSAFPSSRGASSKSPPILEDEAAFRAQTGDRKTFGPSFRFVSRWTPLAFRLPKPSLPDGGTKPGGSRRRCRCRTRSYVKTRPGIFAISRKNSTLPGIIPTKRGKSNDDSSTLSGDSRSSQKGKERT